MRKLTLLAVCIAALLAGLTWTACKDKKSEPTGKDGSDSLKKVLERGEYLANHVAGCIDCHSKRDFNKYSGPVIPGTEGGGGFVFDEKLLGFPGKIYGRNITPDNETGIGTWTDEEIIKAVTLGISKNGDTLFPLMPYMSYNHMAKSDLLSIIAYIRTIKPIRNKVEARVLPMPMAMIYPGPMLQPTVDGNVLPPSSDKVKYGEYLTTMADCAACHSPANPDGSPDMTRRFAGGYVFDAGLFKVGVANITPDSTGIGSWSEEKFLQKFTHYREEKNYNFNPGRENTIMPLSEYAGMTDDDLKAIYAFLRTVKPVVNKVEKYPK